MESKRHQQQAEDADRAQPEYVIREIPGRGLAQQDLVPNQRAPDDTVGQDGEKRSVG